MGSGGLRILKFLVLIFLIFSLLILVVGGVFVFVYPKSAIGLIEGLVPVEKTEPLRLKGVGVLGDSQADEYRADDSRGLTYGPTTLNWVEQLQKYRQVNFGAWGEWGEPRRTGYAYNWARTGATMNSMFVSGQVVGLTEQVRKGDVNLVIIEIGANDYAPFITPDGYDAIYNGKLTELDLLRKENTLVADLTTAVDALRAAGKVHILLVLIPDWGNHLGVRVAFPLPEPRERVSEIIAETNASLQTMAESRKIATLDPNAFYEEVFSTSPSEITVGKQTLTAIFPSDDPRSVFLEDGTHAGTVLNGLFANRIMSTLNSFYGTTLKPFSEQEILSHAGL